MTYGDGTFDPQWVSPPGDTISDLIDEGNRTHGEWAVRLGISIEHLNRLIEGSVPLSEELASRVASEFGSTKRFWMRREAIYRQRLAKLESKE